MCTAWGGPSPSLLINTGMPMTGTKKRRKNSRAAVIIPNTPGGGGVSGHRKCVLTAAGGRRAFSSPYSAVLAKDNLHLHLQCPPPPSPSSLTHAVLFVHTVLSLSHFLRGRESITI